MIPLVSSIASVDLILLRDRVLTASLFRPAPHGDYPWDRWEKAALEAGVRNDLAGLGRAVFREAFQHDWSNELKAECGWIDGGAEMILHALAAPDEAVTRWEALIEADGYPDEMEAPRIDLDPYELADRLEAVGVKSNIARL